MKMKETLKFDLIAGLSVFLVAIPLCLGIALACGAPLISGLVAGIIGGIVIGPLSNSHLSVSGPAAGLVAIVLAGIADIGSYQGFITAVFLSGLLQILMGVGNAGRFTKFLPRSVVEGMLAAIGIILIIKQYPVLLGKSEAATFNSIVLGIGVFCLLLIVLWDKFFASRFKLIPGSLVVVVVGTVGTYLLYRQDLSAAYFVQIPSISSFGELKAVLTYPDWGIFGSFAVYKTAIVLALVASIETLLCVNAIDRLDPLKRSTNQNRELMAQGVGNAMSGLIGGLPITSVIIRSSVNLNAGAKSKFSTIFHGTLILLAVFVGASLMNLVPLVALAAVLIFTGYKLAHPLKFKAAWNMGKNDFVAFMVTVVLVVQVDLLFGVLTGILVYYTLPILLRKMGISLLTPAPAKASALKERNS